MKKLLFFFLFLLVFFKSVVFFNQKQIMHPQKRVLQSYHYDWLDNPAKLGMKIEKYFTENQTPYLVVRKNSEENSSKRQALLLQQLGEVKFKGKAGTLSSTSWKKWKKRRPFTCG